MYGGRIDYNMAKPMLPEERFKRIERKVEFMVREGARIDQRIAAHQGKIERHSEQIADLGAFLLRLGQSLETLARNTADGFREIREETRATAEQLRATDERLNILIGIVERKFSG